MYTLDADDRADVGRVLAELRRLGFTGRLNYKADDDTLAGMYGSGASLYTSAQDSLQFETPKSRKKRNH